MVSGKFLCLAALAISGQAFQLLRDQSGFAILPPTNLVLDSLQEVAPPASSYDDVVTTVDESTGEIIHVNLNTKQVKHTGKYQHKYNNSEYKNCNMKSLFARDDNEVTECFNVDLDWQVSQCSFDFIEYNNATDCVSDATKYSCVVAVQKSFDATEKLQNMNPVPAQVRCYHNIKDAKSDGVQNGACAK